MHGAFHTLNDGAAHIAMNSICTSMTVIANQSCQFLGDPGKLNGLHRACVCGGSDWQDSYCLLIFWWWPF